MIRVAVIADSHFDEASRFEECIAVHDFIARDIAERRVDLVIHTGDVFERKSTIREREAVAAWIVAVTEHAPLLIVRGNHDVIDGAVSDLAIFRQLATRHPVIVEEAAAVHTIETAGGLLHVGALAWPRRAELAARAAEGDVEALGGSAMHAVLTGFRHQFEARPGPRVLASHAMVTGSMTSTGQPLIGHHNELGLADLSLAGAHLIALGHIHLGQDWSIDSAPVVYPGSPRRTSFGETEEKGYLVADFGEAENGTWSCTSWERVPTPCREMLLAEDEWGVVGDAAPGWLVGWQGLDPELVGNAEIRLRYAVAPDQRDAARLAAGDVRRELLERGAHTVKVEEVVRASTRARAPEIAAAKTLPEQIEAFWSAKGTALTPERKARVFARLAEIESEAA